MKRKKEFWYMGEMSDLSRALNTYPSHISDILRRRKGVSAEAAIVLEKITKKVLGKEVPKEAWVFNRYTKHPAFKGKPKKI